MGSKRDVFISTLKREQRDIVPLYPRDLTLGMDLLDIPTDRIFGNTYDSRLSADCVIALMDHLGSYATCGCIFTYSLEAFGGQIKYPPGGIPYASGFPLEDPSKLDDLTPSDIVNDLLKGMRSSCMIVKEKRPDVALSVNVPGPMTMAGYARGLETLMMDLVSDKILSEHILQFCADAIEEDVRFVSKDIADSVFFASASDNPDMIGEEDFVRYSVRHIRHLSDVVHKDGILSIFHPHGVFSTDDRKDLLSNVISSGVDGFQFSEGNEPEGIAETCDGRCAILGGVDAYSTLLLGPEKRIRRDTGRFLQSFKDTSYIMTCSCSVNRGLSIDNLSIMADELHRYNGGLR